MSDHERAAVLAEEISEKGLSWSAGGYRLSGNGVDLIVAALRAYARPVSVSEEMVARAKKALFKARIVDFFSVRAALEAALGVARPVSPPAGVREVATRAVLDLVGKKTPLSGGDIADAVLSAITAAGYLLTPVVAGQTVGPGLIAAPVEPPEALLDTMDSVIGEMVATDEGWSVSSVVDLYRAMLAAITTEAGQ